jgi:hypothetical protein
VDIGRASLDWIETSAESARLKEHGLTPCRVGWSFRQRTLDQSPPQITTDTSDLSEILVRDSCNIRIDNDLQHRFGRRDFRGCLNFPHATVRGCPMMVIVSTSRRVL